MYTFGLANPQTFESAARAGFDAMGLPPDSDTLRTRQHDWVQIATAQALSGAVDMMATRYPRGQSPQLPEDQERPLAPVYQQKYFSLNGLLRHDTGRYKVKVLPHWGRPGMSPIYAETHWVDTEVFSSPQSINHAAQKLGRTPGVDAFKLTRHPGWSLYSARQYIEGFAAMEAPAADPAAAKGDWDDVNDDLAPSGHVNSWFCTSATGCRAISARAADIIEVYGDEIDAPEVERPKEITQFVESLDSLSMFTHSLFLQTTAAPSNFGQLEPATYVNLLERRGILEAVGLIPASGTYEGAMRNIVRLRWSTIRHVAQMLVTLEQVQPNPGLTNTARAARTDRLHAIARRADERTA